MKGNKIKHLAHVLTLLSLIWQMALATGTINEFKLQSANLYELSLHNRNCTTTLDDQIAVTFCEDGYMVIDDSQELISPKETIPNTANVTLNHKGTLKDLRLGKFLSMVDPRAEKLTIIRKSDLKSHGIKLNTTDVGGEPPMLLGG